MKNIDIAEIKPYIYKIREILLKQGIYGGFHYYITNNGQNIYGGVVAIEPPPKKSPQNHIQNP